MKYIPDMLCDTSVDMSFVAAFKAIPRPVSEPESQVSELNSILWYLGQAPSNAFFRAVGAR